MFRELVGSLKWLTSFNRPGGSNAIRSVARYRSAPNIFHWKAALGNSHMYEICMFPERTASMYFSGGGGLLVQITPVRQPIRSLYQTEYLVSRCLCVLVFQHTENYRPFFH